ncbi:hypothetical protein [Microbacterium sp. NPDC096154]|uniref:hypothetical protein n=1 Tax=Microbacterium sp. NPDC096154 TaxID=3155549 RepID=UPI00332BCC87
MARRDLDLIRNVDEALRGDAFDLIGYASRVLEMLRRPIDPNGAPVSGMPTLTEMVDRTLADAVRQSDALLLAMAPLLDGAGAADTALAERIRAEARGRWRTLPAWLEAGDDPEITGVAAIEHALGADATIVVGAVLGDGTPATATVFVDRDGGVTIDDAFVAPETFQAALAAGTKGVDAEEFPRVEITPADARARIEQAMAQDLVLEPPLVTDTWPAARPMLAWILRALPEGGSGFPRQPADPELDEALAAATFAPDHARALIRLNREHSGSGDPRLWSDTFVEDLLREHLLDDETAVADPDGALATLRALVIAGHEHAGVPAKLTARTLEALDELEPEFLDLVEMEADGDLPHDDPAGRELALLALRVGGRRHLEALDALPITRVVPDQRGLDDRARAGLDAVRALIEPACTAVSDDPELAVSASGVAGMLAEADPRLFAKGKPELAAAAVVWIAGVANDAFAEPGSEAALMRALGLRGATPAGRAAAYLGALGVDDPEEWVEFPSFSDPTLLTARTRRELIRRRDAAKSGLAAAPGPGAKSYDQPRDA